MKAHVLLIPAFLLVLNTAVQAQDEKTFYSNESTVLTSDILDEDRKISIYLPDDYAY